VTHGVLLTMNSLAPQFISSQHELKLGRPEQYNQLEEVRSFKGVGANLKVGQKEGDDQ
jgi:hypothetical protein